MRKIYISAGHSNKAGRDRGAASNGYIEGELTVRFRDLLKKELERLGANVIVDNNDTILSQSIAFFKNLTSNKDIVLDIHWNSATPKATGVEHLIPGEYSIFEKELAKKLSDVVSETLNIPLRGVTAGAKGVKTELESHHGRLGWMRLTGENILCEMCFISNPNDMKKYFDNEIQLVKNYAQVLFEQVKENQTECVYTVIKGDSLSKIANKFNTTVEKLKKDNNLTTNVIQIGWKLKV